MGAFLLVVFGLLFYFLPSLLASRRKNHNSTAIFVLNLLLGWTAIGWIVALIWALTKPAPATGGPV